MNFNERLQHLASLKKVDQIQIANDLGIDPSTVHKWWHGKVKPRWKSIVILSEYFSCNIEWLGNEKGEMKKKPKQVLAASEKQYDLLETSEPEQDKATIRKKKYSSLLARFGYIVDFIIDEYGENEVMINDFMERLEHDYLRQDGDYQYWRQEKMKKVMEQQKKANG